MVEKVLTISSGWLLPCPGRCGGAQETPCAYGGGHQQTPTSGGSTSKGGHPGDHLSPQPTLGPARTAGTVRVLTNTTTTAICPRYGDTCKNVTLLFKTSIIVQCSGRGGPSLFNCRACLVFIMLRGRGGNYFYSKPYVEHQQMHIL